MAFAVVLSRSIAACLAAAAVVADASTGSCTEPARAPSAQRDPAEPGPFAFRRTSLLEEGVRLVVTHDLICPLVSAHRPVVVLENDGASNLHGLGDHLASWGFIVAFDVAPTDLIERAGDHDDCNASRDVGWVGVGSGGHVAWHDARQRRDLDSRAVVAIDPGPRGLGETLEHSMMGPDGAQTLVLIAQPNTCVPAIKRLEPGKSRPGTYAHIVGGHCDVQGPDATECENACGASTPRGKAVSLRLTTAWLLAHLADEHWAQAWLPPGFVEGVQSVKQVSAWSPNPWTLDVQPSLILGSALHTSDSHSDLTVGLRASFPWAREPERTWGIGPYAEFLSVGGDLDVGAGVSSRISAGNVAGLTSSVGVFARSHAEWDTGVTAGVRLDVEGVRRPLLGIRIDGRAGFGPLEERAIFVGADLDALGLMMVALLPMLTPIGD